jgi:hypothetical protein
VVHEYGPYTLYDLDALLEDGKRFELAGGWLTELSPSPWHDHAADWSPHPCTESMIERSTEDLTGYSRSNPQRYRKTGLAQAS